MTTKDETVYAEIQKPLINWVNLREKCSGATLTYISSPHGDWAGIYIDNDLQCEGHSIPVHDWLLLIETWNIGRTRQLEVNGEWLEECGSFPTSFNDIPQEAVNVGMEYCTQEYDILNSHNPEIFTVEELKESVHKGRHNEDDRSGYWEEKL